MTTLTNLTKSMEIRERLSECTSRDTHERKRDHESKYNENKRNDITLLENVWT